MLDRLPDELLVAVLDSLAAPAYAPRAYQARQGTLRALCLTSRRLRRLAQPDLFRHVYVHERTRLDQVRDVDDEALRAHTKVYRFELDRSRALEGDKYTPLAAVAAGLRYPNVEEVRVEAVCHALDLRVLGNYSRLRRLFLNGLDLDDPAAVHLPCVDQLRLEDLCVEPAFLERWLDPEFLPSVKAIYLSDLCHDDDETPFFPQLSLGFRAQVDFVQSYIAQDDALARYGQQDAPPFLFEFHRIPRAGVLPRYGLVDLSVFNRIPDETRLRRAGTLFGVLGDQVEAAARGSDGQPALRTLILPASFANVAASDDAVSQALDIVPDALRRLRRAGVTLSFSDAAGRPGDDLVSPVFWAHARKMREGREGGNGGGL
ncbi:hypothetical protein JCM10449v2_003235 [Rhodotorula kratochvilovae]